MAELWRDLVELLRSRPALWLPVLIADLLSYGINLGRNSLVRVIVLHNTAQQSVLGGTVVHGPMTASAMESTTIVALLLSWLTNFARILLYTCAFVATAALIQAFRERASKPAAAVLPALGRFWGGILDIALRALALYAVAALIMSWFTPYMASHGHTAVLRNPWFNFAVALLVLLLLSALLSPVALRVLSGRAPGRLLTRSAQHLSFVLVTVAALLATFVAANGHELSQVPPGARYPLEIIGSLLIALPYVLLFTGLSLLAQRLAREDNEFSPDL